MEKTTAFVTSDNQVFRTREEAQRHELEIIFNIAGSGNPEQAAEILMSNKDAIRAILADRKPRQPKPVAKRKSKPPVALVDPEPAAKESALPGVLFSKLLTPKPPVPAT